MEIIKRFKNKAQDQLGIEIDGDKLRAVKYNNTNSHSRFISVEFELPVGCVRNGLILNNEALIDSLQFLINENQWQGLNVITTILSRQIIVRHLELPILRGDELSEAIRWEIAQYLPYDSEDAVIDWYNLGLMGSPSVDKITILLAAVPAKLALSYQHVFRSTGLNLLAIDIVPSALRRWLLEIGKEFWPDSSILTLGIINIAHEMTNIVILKQGKIHFARPIAFGMQDILQTTIETGVATGNGGKIETLSLELKKTIDYYRAQFNGEKLGRILLTGAMADDLNLHKILEECMGIPVHKGRLEGIQKLEPQFASTAGLAIKGVL